MLKLKKYHHISTSSPEEKRAVPIVGDAAIATSGTGHGRLIPLVILDTTNRPDLEKVIDAQQHVVNGEVVVQWGALPKRKGYFALFLRFERPIERVAIIEFDISTQGVIVEQVFQAGAIYLQYGRPGDRLKHDLNRSKMLVEVVNTGAQKIWDKLYYRAIIKKMRRAGFGRHEARVRAKEYLKTLREVGRFRM